MGIFWIASYPKSGNTWIRSFLANVIAPQRPVPLDKLHVYCASEASAKWYKGFGDVETMDARPSKESMEMRSRVQERISLNAAPRDILLKTHNQRCDVAGMPLIRPDLTVGAVYILRDPRDVVVSLADHYDFGFDDAIAYMKRSNAIVGPNGAMQNRQMFEMVGNWSDHVLSWTEKPHPRQQVLRYEDCLQNPEATLGKLPSIMGITHDIWRIKAAIAASGLETMKKLEDEQGFNEKPAHAETFFARGAAGGWKDLLSAAQIKKIERDHKKVMQKFGYL